MSSMEQLRQSYHAAICGRVLGNRSGVPNIADISNSRSIQIARGIVDRMGFSACPSSPVGQGAGALFEALTREYLDKAFRLLSHLRPGEWVFSLHGEITDFEQYEHLKVLRGFCLSTQRCVQLWATTWYSLIYWWDEDQYRTRRSTTLQILSEGALQP